MWTLWGTSLMLVQPSDQRQVGNWAWGNGDHINAAVGNHFSFVGQDLAALQWRLGIEGGVFMAFDTGGPLTYHLQTIDGTFAVPIDLQREKWVIRAEWRHDSAHFGDGIRMNDQKPPENALDTLSYETVGLYVGHRGAWFQPQAGCRLSTRRTGALCQLGVIYTVQTQRSTPYVAGTYRAAGGVLGGSNFSAQLGYQWSDHWTFRTGLQWTSGANDAGKLSHIEIHRLGIFLNWNAIGSG